jgi:chromosome segregation protein
MLKLKKIHILGFKSFCDRTELSVTGQGLAVVVGPNGCGKSNILDGVSWVLGEQSAKSLRGTHMSDVIFAGTRDRKPLGMAEVTLTLVDPEAYEGPIPVEPQVEVDPQGLEDWDEEALRKERAEEAEDIIASEQPGQVIEGEEGAAPQITPSPEPAPQLNAEAAQNGPVSVVLKIRRRKFQRTFQRGEIVITRRLFRTGESEYLLNGKLCRLRDIQDIFMGTGLGPESYAIIGQERIGQLLSSKPHDRRAIIEEAAGITRFKTKKRLAELRLEAAKQNLARVDDIFEEVTRQMNSLKRQAAKAERYAEVRNDLRTRLRVVLASRMALMDAEQAGLNTEINALSEQINEGAARIGTMEASQHSLTERGYDLDRAQKEAQTQANSSTVELERAAARERGNTERVAELEARIAATAAEIEQTRTQLAGISEERTQQKSFLETAAGEARDFRQKVEARQQQARAAQEEVFTAERNLESQRRSAMQLLTQAGNARNSTAQAEESLAALEREAERLEAEMRQSRNELEELGVRQGQARLSFDTAAESLKSLESEIASLRSSLQSKRTEEVELRKTANQLRAEVATLTGRRDSLQSLIRNHSYSTESVRRLLKPGALSNGMAPVGTLADFVEVSGEHEGVVDEFLREELNYLVVHSWSAAEHGVNLLKSGVDGRATFLIHDEAQRNLFAASDEQIAGDGIIPLKDTIKVLNGFGRSLEAILPKLRDGYIVEDPTVAQKLAEQHTHAYFLTPSGECFHNTTVTGGKPATEGPLALKRDLRETERKLDTLESKLKEAETQATSLARSIEEMASQLEARSEERRQAERDTANQGAALKQMEAEVQRIDRRVQEWTVQSARNKDARELKRSTIEQKRAEAEKLEAEHKTAEVALETKQSELAEMRRNRESIQQEAAQLTAQLAGLEERRRGAEAAFQRIDRLHTDLERRILAIEQQRASAEAERTQRQNENTALAAQQTELTAARDATLAQVHTLTAEAKTVREELAVLETDLKTNRSTLDLFREDRTGKLSTVAKLRSDLEHIEAGTLTEVNEEAAALRADESIVRIVDEQLVAEEETCRTLRQKMEQMGPVNMMALEEYKETADRHTFLEAQRKDLVESIENTQETIKEIDQISRTKFDEAFARINENFGQVFTRLFNGGQAFLRLTDTENQAESGLDIVASPPGKKLQNVLLLSGGEKALTAISLLVGIFQFQPSPFCVLDEVDAALDETNVGRLADLLHTLGKETQFLIVTHSKRMMHNADMIYGVTMQEPGVSKVVSVKLGGGANQELQRATA